MADRSMPWQTDGLGEENPSKHFKYKYHPGGDTKKEPKAAPSALHSVVVPNVTLPKVSGAAPFYSPPLCPPILPFLSFFSLFFCVWKLRTRQTIKETAEKKLLRKDEEYGKERIFKHDYPLFLNFFFLVHFG
jgi:hypothetical protein